MTHLSILIAINPISPQVMLMPMSGARVFVNGAAVSEVLALSTGNRIVLGTSHVFRWVITV